ncbi:MAG: hypothetical protein IT373_30210, partial [Polyangiaceae bacterium]|nr:hypothetical protein [Polyangiaceae bacterium]
CHKWGDPRGEFLLEHGPVGSPERRKLQAGARLGSLEHLSLETQGLGLLRVRVADVHAEFCGVVVETDPKLHPGVVVDNLGLNGGRYATALSWDPTGWKKELLRRPPDLAVIEYGGNEAGDPNFRPAAYKRNLLSVVARVREVRPEVSCLVIGLTERNDAEDRIVPVRDVQREAAAEVGCLFWDSYEQMGGKGSMRVWQADGRGADDGVHLKPKGYEELGQRLAADLLATYHGP